MPDDRPGSIPGDPIARPGAGLHRGRRRAHRVGVALLAALAAASGAVLLPGSATAAPPDPPPASSPSAQAQERQASGLMSRMTLPEKVGQLFVADVFGTAADQAHPTNRQRYGVDTPAEIVARYHVGGVIYFNNPSTDNIVDPAQVAGLSNGLQQAARRSGARIPLLISIDQEGGRVTRLGEPATEYPSGMALGAAAVGHGGDTRDARALAAVSAAELRALGINQNFAPVADVNSNPLNPIIGSRSFSSDPALASALVAAQVRGYQEGTDPGPRRPGQAPPRRGDTEVSTSAKHFPGHGDAATDSHTGLPTINRTEAQWRTTDLPPFRAAIDADIDSIMTAHIAMPSLDASGEPATLSKSIMTGLLRGELRYRGVIVSDSLQMAGVRQLHPDTEVPVLALQAGVDQMLMPPDLPGAVTAVLDAVRTGRLTEARIDESVRRILILKARRGVLTTRPVDVAAAPGLVGTAAHRATVAAATDRSATLLRNDPGPSGTAALPLPAGRILVTGWHRPDYPGYPADPVTALADALRAAGRDAVAVPTATAATPAVRAPAVTAARDADVVVVLTNGLRSGAGQRALVDELRATGTPLVAVGVQEPYDPAFADVPTWLVSYDWRAVTMRSLAPVLLGGPARGRLPVAIPAADGTMLYPFGHGLAGGAPA